MRFCASLIALSEINLRKLSFSYDPTDRIGAQDQIAQAAVKGEVLARPLPSARCRRPPHSPQHPSHAVQQARREGSLPGRWDAGKDKRCIKISYWQNRKAAATSD